MDRARSLAADTAAAGRVGLCMRAQLVESDTLYRLGRTAASARILRRVHRWAGTHSDHQVLARSHRAMARFFTQVGNPQLALEHAIHAVEALEAVYAATSDRVRVQFVTTLADAYSNIGARAEASERYAWAERMSLSVGDVRTQLRVINNLAFHEYQAGDLEAAERAIRRLVLVAQEHGVDLDLYARETIARVQLATGRVEAAVDTLLPVLDDGYVSRFREADAQADALVTLAEALRLTGDLPRAESALQTCRRLCDEQGLVEVRTRSLHQEAELLAAQGRFEQALERYKAFHGEAVARYSAERDARVGALLAVYENTEARRAGRRARELSLRDPLTELYNRRYLDAELPILFRRAAAEGTPFSVALLDVDHFKDVNDRFSHEVGDRVLQAIAGRITRAVAAFPGGAFAARLGGEEFLLVLPGAGPSEAHRFADELRLAVRGYDWPAIRPGLAVRASVGVATSPQGEGDHHEVMRLADVGLYAAKRAGRDRTVSGLVEGRSGLDARRPQPCPGTDMSCL